MLSQIELRGIHYHISESTESFIKEKFSKFDYLKHLIVDGTIRIIKETNLFKIEVDIHLRHNRAIHFETKHELLYPAIETMGHKLKQILSDEHKKNKDHKSHGNNKTHHSGLNDIPVEG